MDRNTKHIRWYKDAEGVITNDALFRIYLDDEAEVEVRSAYIVT